MPSDDARNAQYRLDRRVLGGSLAVLSGSLAVLVGLAILAYVDQKLTLYIKGAAFLYFVLSVFFLLAIGAALIGGHVGSSEAVEAPKLDLFEREKLE